MVDALENVGEDPSAAQARNLAEECAKAIGDFTQVRDMVQQPGWETFILELQRLAVRERESLQDVLDGILLERTDGLEKQYIESKIRVLALETAIQIYLQMRERARTAKEVLDKTPVIDREFPQNG